MCRWAETGPTTVPKPMPVRDQEKSPESEQRERARSAGGSAVETMPSRPRRTFSAAEKLRIVKRADACLASGQRGALEAMLREEGIYSSLLSSWRTQLGARELGALEARKPGRKPKLDAKDKRNAELLKRNAHLEREVHILKALVTLQKKAHELLGIALPTNTEEE
jgi:transposase